jgi:hypothetical protein
MTPKVTLWLGALFMTALVLPAQNERVQRTTRMVTVPTDDKNGDGITQTEWHGTVSEFRRLDRNGDGVLSGSEIPENRSSSSAQPERTHPDDKNRDGTISQAEWRGSISAFRQLDRNGDGVLLGSEIPLALPSR